MENFNLTKADNNKVSCVKQIPDDPRGIVIAVHGFTSSKESPTVRLLLEKMPAAGLGVIGIDLPGHGTGESAKETLRIPGGIDSIEAAERYALKEYPGRNIYYFGSSFGAYLLGIYISTRDHAGRRAFWRSAAVNMPQLFHKEEPTEQEKKLLKELEDKGYFDMSMDQNRPVRVTRQMYQDLLEHDLFKLFDPDRFGTHRIAMAHGEMDSVIDPDAARKFAAQFDIPVNWFKGEGHSLSNDPATPERVAELAAELFLRG